MSYRAIEMQIALPRTQDLGQLQDQLQQRGQVGQHQLAQAQLQEDLKKRKIVNELNQKGDEKISEQSTNKENFYQPNSLPKSKTKNNKYRHPFLGNRIDFNG